MSILPSLGTQRQGLCVWHSLAWEREGGREVYCGESILGSFTFYLFVGFYLCCQL